MQRIETWKVYAVITRLLLDFWVKYGVALCFRLFQAQSCVDGSSFFR